jgi:hypothetical protein
MKSDSVNIMSRYRGVIRIVVATALILMVPLVAMQFTDEVNWDFTDFAVLGSLLLGTGLLYELGARRLGKSSHRAILGIGLAAALLLIWIELAVGIFGAPFSGR